MSIHDVKDNWLMAIWSGNLGDTICMHKGNDRSVFSVVKKSCHALSTGNSKI